MAGNCYLFLVTFDENFQFVILSSWNQWWMIISGDSIACLYFWITVICLIVGETCDGVKISVESPDVQKMRLAQKLVRLKIARNCDFQVQCLQVFRPSANMGWKKNGRIVIFCKLSRFFYVLFKKRYNLLKMLLFFQTHLKPTFHRIRILLCWLIWWPCFF